MASDTGTVGMLSTTSAQALWIPAAGMCETRGQALAPLESGQARVRTLYSGISRGTESLVFHGRVPSGEFERMRGPHMEGDFRFPVKYGYSCVGRIEEGDASRVGRAVFCLHPHQDLFVVAEDTLFLLPEDLPPSRAVLAANMETALNIVWDAGILPGDRVAVFGAGVVGSLVAYLASGITGTDIQLIDRNPAKAALAAKLGLSFATTEMVAGEFDVLINASGSPALLARAA